MNIKYKDALDTYRNNYHDITAALIIEELENDIYRDKIVEQLREENIKCDEFALERISEYLYDEYLSHDCLHPCDEYFLDEYLSEAVNKFIEDMTL